MTYEAIGVDIDAATRVATVTLNRPDKLNSFTRAMHQELRAALDEVEAAGARALILTGAGRGFCAGQDLADLDFTPGAMTDLGDLIDQHFNPLIRRLQALPLPVIAAVNGTAAGAGANLALACDLVLAARSASFIQAFVKIGLVPDSGGTWFLPQRVGMARAFLLYSNFPSALGELIRHDKGLNQRGHRGSTEAWFQGVIASAGCGSTRTPDHPRCSKSQVCDPKTGSLARARSEPSTSRSARR